MRHRLVATAFAITIALASPAFAQPQLEVEYAGPMVPSIFPNGMKLFLPGEQDVVLFRAGMTAKGAPAGVTLTELEFEFWYSDLPADEIIANAELAVNGQVVGAVDVPPADLGIDDPPVPMAVVLDEPLTFAEGQRMLVELRADVLPDAPLDLGFRLRLADVQVAGAAGLTGDAFPIGTGIWLAAISIPVGEAATGLDGIAHAGSGLTHATLQAFDLWLPWADAGGLEAGMLDELVVWLSSPINPASLFDLAHVVHDVDGSRDWSPGDVVLDSRVPDASGVLAFAPMVAVPGDAPLPLLVTADVPTDVPYALLQVMVVELSAPDLTTWMPGDLFTRGLPLVGTAEVGSVAIATDAPADGLFVAPDTVDKGLVALTVEALQVDHTLYSLSMSVLAGNPAHIETVRLWHDSDGDGLPGDVEAALGSAPVPGFSATILLADPMDLPVGVPVRLLLTGDFSGATADGMAYQVQITGMDLQGDDGSSVSPSTPPSAVITGQASVDPLLRIQWGPSATGIQPGAAVVGHTLQLDAFGTISTVESLWLTVTGTAALTDVGALSLVHDKNSDGKADGGDTVVAALAGVNSDGLAPFSVTGVVLNPGGGLDLLLVWELAPTAAPGGTLNVKLHSVNTVEDVPVTLDADFGGELAIGDADDGDPLFDSPPETSLIQAAAGGCMAGPVSAGWLLLVVLAALARRRVSGRRKIRTGV